MVKQLLKILLLAAFCVATIHSSVDAVPKTITFINKSGYDIEGFYFQSKEGDYSSLVARDIPNGRSLEIEVNKSECRDTYFDINFSNGESISFRNCDFSKVAKITIAKVNFVNKTGYEIEFFNLKAHNGYWESETNEIAVNQSKDMIILPEVQDSLEIYVNDDNFSIVGYGFSNTTEVTISQKDGNFYMNKK